MPRLLAWVRPSLSLVSLLGVVACTDSTTSTVFSMAEKDLDCPRHELRIIGHVESAFDDGSEQYVVEGCGQQAAYACYDGYGGHLGDSDHTCCNLGNVGCGSDWPF